MSTPGAATFREVAETKESAPAPEAKTPGSVPDGQGVETPIALYQELEGKPYSATYFEMGPLWDSHDSWREDLSAIDSYYQSRVAEGEYKDGKDSYEAMIKEAEKVTGTKLAGTNLKVAKIAEYVRFMQKIDKLESERERWQ